MSKQCISPPRDSRSAHPSFGCGCVCVGGGGCISEVFFNSRLLIPGIGHESNPGYLKASWGPFLERPGNLSGPISVFGADKCFRNEVKFC